MRYFDYEKIAQEANISKNQLDELNKIVREEFPIDDMMFELHLMRVCMAIRDRHISLDEVLHLKAA